MKCSTVWVRRGAWGQRGVEVSAQWWPGSWEWANIRAGIQPLWAARTVQFLLRAVCLLGFNFLPSEIGIWVLYAGGLQRLLWVPEDFPGTVLEHILKVIISCVSCAPLKVALQISGDQGCKWTGQPCLQEGLKMLSMWSPERGPARSVGGCGVQCSPKGAQTRR